MFATHQQNGIYMIQTKKGLPLLLILLWLAPLGLLRPGSLALAQTGQVFIRSDPQVFEVGVGQVETLDILIENAVDVYGIDLRARYDPALVEVVDLETGKPAAQMAAGSFMHHDFVLRNEADNNSGMLQYIFTQLNPSLPVNGSGIIISIQIRGKALGESQLEFVSLEIADNLGHILLSEALPGILRVVPAKPETPTPFVLLPSASSTETSPTRIEKNVRITKVPETEKFPKDWSAHPKTPTPKLDPSFSSESTHSPLLPGQIGFLCLGSLGLLGAIFLISLAFLVALSPGKR
jgi:hypothetical protein